MGGGAGTAKGRGVFPAELSQGLPTARHVCRARRAERRGEVGTEFTRSGGRTWKSTFHFGERGSVASAALQGPVLQVWGKKGPSWECTQVETIRGIIWAESSWRSLGENCVPWVGAPLA